VQYNIKRHKTIRQSQKKNTPDYTGVLLPETCNQKAYASDLSQHLSGFQHYNPRLSAEIHNKSAVEEQWNSSRMTVYAA